MKMMKKLSLLVALALIVTIGGVYATWNYASGSQVSSAESPLNVDLVSYQLVGGGLSVLDGTGVKISIDDNKLSDGNPGNDHRAELYFENDMIIIFTPSSDTTEESITSMSFNFSFELRSVTSDPWLYAGEPIFTLNNSNPIQPKHLEKIGDATVVSGYNLSELGLAGKYYMVLTADEVDSMVDLRPSGIVLDTVSDWDAFDIARTQGNIMVIVSAIS